MLRKFICGPLSVSVINAVCLKGIEQLVFKQWTFGVFQVFQIYRLLCKIVKNLVHMVGNCDIVIGQYKMKLHLQGGVNLDTQSEYHSVNRGT